MVELRRVAWQELTEYANRRLPNETGGILLGYRTRRGVRIVAVIEVVDPNATATNYVMRAEPAQRMLDEARGSFPADSPVGFVGDWHVHPAPQGPSTRDRSSLGRVGSSYRRAIVSVVAVNGPGPDWQLYGLIHARRRIRPVRIDMID